MYLSLPSTGDSSLHLRLLVLISLIRGSFSHSASSPKLSFPFPGHWSLLPKLFPISVPPVHCPISPAAAELLWVREFLFLLGFFGFFFCLFHLGLLLNYFHERAPLIFFLVQIPWTWVNFFQPLVLWDLALNSWMQFFILSFHLSWMQPNSCLEEKKGII